MNELTAKQTNDLMRIRDAAGYIEEDVPALLNIIDALQLGNKHQKIAPVHGWSVILRGRYPHSETKKMVVLQFIVITSSCNDDDVLTHVKNRYGSNLLADFSIVDYTLLAIEEKTVVTGTGICG